MTLDTTKLDDPTWTPLQVDEESHDERLDKFLADALSEEFSRERLKQLISDGQVFLLEADTPRPITKPAYRVTTGQEWRLKIPELEPINLEAENIPLEILFEDEHLLVVHKPSDMLTHPSGQEMTGTLVNALMHHCQESLSGINGILRPGIVHRLDRQTAGLLMVAKTDTAHRGLSLQLSERTAKREYRAIAQGNPKTDEGFIDLPIGRHPKHREKMGIVSVAKGGREAYTAWSVVERIQERFFLAKLNLKTGRTHQIRVHLAHQGYPILGDPLYGTGLIQQLVIPKFLKEHGQFLQAVKLEFIHPITEMPMMFEQPMNSAMTDLLQRLRAF